MDFYQSLSGMMEMQLISADIPSSLEAITDANIMLYNVQQTDEVTVRFRIRRIHFQYLKQMIKKRGDALSVISRPGLYWYFVQAWKRPVLLL